MDIETKLKDLRKKYPSESSLKQIDDDEKALRHLIVQKDFASNEVVVEIVKDAKAKIEDINFLLSYDDEMNQPEKNIERRAMFRERNVWQFMLDRFGVDTKQIDEQIGMLENGVDTELSR